MATVPLTSILLVTLALTLTSTNASRRGGHQKDVDMTSNTVTSHVGRVRAEDKVDTSDVSSTDKAGSPNSERSESKDATLCLGKDCKQQVPTIGIRITSRVTRRRNGRRRHDQRHTTRHGSRHNPHQSQHGLREKIQMDDVTDQNQHFKHTHDSSSTEIRTSEQVSGREKNRASSQREKTIDDKDSEDTITQLSSFPRRKNAEKGDTISESHGTRPLKTDNNKQPGTIRNSPLLAALTSSTYDDDDIRRHRGDVHRKNNQGQKDVNSGRHHSKTNSKVGQNWNDDYEQLQVSPGHDGDGGHHGDGRRHHGGKSRHQDVDDVSRDRGHVAGAEGYRGRTVGARRYSIFSDKWRPSGPSSARAHPYSDHPRRPADADRLEQRLSPSLAVATERLVVSLRDVIKALTAGLTSVRNDNDFVFNGTRYVIMMGVRERLQEIAEANDMAYDTVMRASLLMKDIYLRAHQKRLTGPSTASLSTPERRMATFNKDQTAAQDELDKATKVLTVAQNMKRERERLDARLQQVREKFQDDFARNDLRTLVYYVNSTSQRLMSEFAYSERAALVKRNTAILYSSRDNLQEARNLLYKASNYIASSSDNYRGSYSFIQDRKNQRNDDGGVGAPVPIRHIRDVSTRHDQPINDEHTVEERAKILEIIKRLKNHAREQESLAVKIERMLSPSISVGQDLLSRSDLETATLLSGIAQRINTLGQNLYSVLDTIRVLINAEQELRWPKLQPSRVCREDEEGEGSGCLPDEGGLVLEGEEGSGDITPGLPTDDEDFLFVDENEPPLKRTKPATLDEFANKLSVYVDGVKLRSNNILKQGDKLQDSTLDLSSRWSDMKKAYSTAQQTHNDWVETKKSFQNFTQFAVNIHQKVEEVSDRVTRSAKSIETRMAKALEIAERKLAEAQGQMAGGGGDDDDDDDDVAADDATVMLAAVEKVKEAQKERDVVQTLRSVAPQTCGQASDHVLKIHANISHLRQQIHTAQQLLRSMQLSVAKSGGGYLSIPLVSSSPSSSSQPSSAPSPLSLLTTVELCIRTQDTEGPVLVVKGNNSASLSLKMEDRKVSVTVYDAAGYNLKTVTSGLVMEENQWYNVNVTRIGKRVLLAVMPRNSNTDDITKNEVTVDMAYLQPQPIHVYVGGVADKEPFSVGKDSWRGCLGELHVNGRAVSLVHTSSTGVPPQLCDSQCAVTPDGDSLVFDGAGFMHFDVTVLPSRGRPQSIHFLFRTWQSSAALLHVANKKQKLLVQVMLTEGGVMIDSISPTESLIFRSQQKNYNDGQFHSLKIQYRGISMYPEIDGQSGVFTTERSRARDISSSMDGVVVGAFVNTSYSFQQTEYRPLIGCMQDLEIDDSLVPVPEAIQSFGSFHGTCNTKSVWSKCVRFGTDSTGISLGEFDRSAKVILLFSASSRGPLLTYNRGDEYESEIRATDSGLELTSSKEDTKYIARPDGVAGELSLLALSDDGKSVTLEAWGKSESFSYVGFWGLALSEDGAHSVGVALTSQDDDLTLAGQLAQLMIGERYIDLSSFRTSNKLSACERPLPDLVMSQPTSESVSLDLDESENTCSKDIRCR